MPYSHTNMLIPKEHDKRVKLTDEQKEKIKELYGKISQRKLAKMFNVSRRTIIFIGDNEKYQHNLELRRLRGGSAIYYDREKHNIAMKKHRHHKQDLKLNNMLTAKPKV
jgi:DNA-binding XRE family transcriptional regulator